MSQTFGQEVPGRHVQQTHCPPARYLVILSSGGAAIARLFLEDRVQVAEFDASTEEVVAMTTGLAPLQGALAPEWDRALAGHTRDERAEANIYTLAV